MCACARKVWHVQIKPVCCGWRASRCTFHCVLALHTWLPQREKTGCPFGQVGPWLCAALAFRVCAMQYRWGLCSVGPASKSPLAKSLPRRSWPSLGDPWILIPIAEPLGSPQIHDSGICASLHVPSPRPGGTVTTDTGILAEPPRNTGSVAAGVLPANKFGRWLKEWKQVEKREESPRVGGGPKVQQLSPSLSGPR